MLIGLGGVKGSGKDTAAFFLVDKYGFKRYAFADNLKLMCIEVFGLSPEQVFDPALKEVAFSAPFPFAPEHGLAIINYVAKVNGIYGDDTEMAMYTAVSKGAVFRNPREVMQFVGTEVCRTVYGPDFHANVVKHALEVNRDAKVVITDMRFPNERDLVKELGGITGLVMGRGGNSGDTHASETSLGTASDYDFVIDNSTSLEDLFAQVDGIVRFKPEV